MGVRNKRYRSASSRSERRKSCSVADYLWTSPALSPADLALTSGGLSYRSSLQDVTGAVQRSWRADIHR